MKKKILKAMALSIMLVGLIGIGTLLYQYQHVRSVTNRLQEAKAQHSKQKAASVVSDEMHESTNDTQDVNSAALGVQDKSVDNRPPPGTKGSQVTACTERYQKYIDSQKFSEVMPKILDEIQEFLESDMENDPCVQKLTEVIDLDHFQSLFLKCEAGKLLTDDSKKACMTLLILGWGAFAETEFANVDPAEMPADALHSKIMFRLIDKDEFLKTAGIKEKEYFFRLMDQMRRTNPKIDYGTTREELVAELYKTNPSAWKDDYARVLEEMEEQDIGRAIMTFYKAHGEDADQEFFNYVDGLTKRNPNSQIAHFYKSCAYTLIKDWDGALREAAEAERLAADRNKHLFPDLRKAIAEKRGYIYSYTWISIATDMPDV